MAIHDMLKSALNKQEIEAFMKSGHIHIENYEPRFLGPVSYDLRLGRLCHIDYDRNETIDLSVDPTFTREETVNSEIVLKPGETALFCTHECISVSPRIMAVGFCRSTLAKIPMHVHVPGLVDPGFSGVLSGNITNLSPAKIKIPHKFRIFQLIFFDVNGLEDYSKREISKNNNIDYHSFYKVKVDKEWRDNWYNKGE